MYRKEEESYGGQRSIDLQMIRDYEQTGCRLKEFLENQMGLNRERRMELCHRYLTE